VLKTNPGCIRAGAKPLLWHPVAKFTITAVCLSVRELCCTKQASLAFYAAVNTKRKSNLRSVAQKPVCSLTRDVELLLPVRYPAQFQIVKFQTEPGLKREKTGDAVCCLYLTNCTVCDAQTKQMAMQMKLFLQQALYVTLPYATDCLDHCHMIFVL